MNENNPIFYWILIIIIIIESFAFNKVYFFSLFPEIKNISYDRNSV